jgi:ABC-2 type transport system ATP-binding protein
MKSAIKINQVNKYFDTFHVLKNIQFNIPKGQIFGLLGPNGAGKTTLLRILNQITKADEGTIEYNDEILTPQHSIKIGYLPEERGLYKKMKVEEQLLYLAQLKGLSLNDAKENMDFWLDKFEISNWKNKTINSLSKGMAQKIQFIATVIHQPEIIILDEPFSGFDPINTNLIKQEILRLKNEKKTIIYSTHNMDSVDEICDHIAIINKGEIILKGKLQTIKEKKAENIFEIVFNGNMISFSNALWTAFSLIQSEDLGPNKIKATVKSTGEAHINELITQVMQSCKIISVQEKIPRINEIFLSEIKNHLSKLNHE